jgi:hypothetical protein
MFRIYEIRNKATHRVEYLNLFREDEKPDDVFRADPNSQGFAGRHDLYIYVNQTQYPTLEDAINAVMELLVKYKLIPNPDPEPEPEPEVKSFSLGMDPEDPRRNIDAFPKEIKQDIVVEPQQFKPKAKKKKD